MPLEGKSRIPKSSQDYHDYVIEVNLPEGFQNITEACVRQTGSRITVDLNCRHGRLEVETEEESV
jgi:hypothetical protein